MNKLVILVTAIGSVAGEYVISRLKYLGHTVIGCDIYDKRWLAYADLPDFFYQVSSAYEETKYVQEIMKICYKHAVEMIFPLTDVEVDLYDHYRDKFEEAGVRICISPNFSITMIRNKYQFAKKVAELCNLVNEIPTCTIDEFLQQKPLWERNATGFIAKLSNGRSSQGLQKFIDREEVEFFAQKHGGSGYIIQPFVQGERIVADVVRSQDTGEIVCVTRKELLSTTNGCGTSVYVFYDGFLERACEELAEKMCVVGCVNFEFLLDGNNTYHVLECNPRFSAGIEFSALAGCDFVERHLNCFCGKSIENFELQHSVYIARKWTEVITDMEV